MSGVSSPDPFRASAALLAECDEAHLLPRPARLSTLSRSDLMLPNGARFYIDHAHPEYSTPEATDPREIVAVDKVGELLLDRCAARVHARNRLHDGASLRLFKNNSDQKGNSYGCHENYLVERTVFQRIMKAGVEPLGDDIAYAVLIPFLVTRTILCGAGKVGAENESARAAFQIAQRADFFETLVGLQTTHRRPILNTRDESHAADQYGRLHVIAGDANLAETSTYMKVGITQILLRMLEDGVALPDLTLEDPLAAVRAVSRDLSFSEPLPLRNGQKITAIEAQREICAIASRHVAALPAPDPHHEVVERWRDSLERLGRDWRLLARTFDWAIKRSVLERFLIRQETDLDASLAWQPVIEATTALEIPGDADATHIRDVVHKGLGQGAFVLDAHLERQALSWSGYRKQREIYFALRRLDLSYHDIEVSGSGVFRRMESAGAVERIVDDAFVHARASEPPRNTRAYARGMGIALYSRFIMAADWEALVFADMEAGATALLQLPDPLSGTADDIGRLYSESPDRPWLFWNRRPARRDQAEPASEQGPDGKVEGSHA